MASVILGDLDDFIAPGQACINPLFTTAADETQAADLEKSGSKGGAAMVLELEDDGGPLDRMVVEEAAKPDLIRTSNTQTAKVSLDDCLACSGCVTSAETVLITQQSAGKLREAVESGRHSVIVASISPQARASLAEKFGLSTAETHARLLTYLRERRGVHHLVDSSLGADFSLLEAGEEFVRRWRHTRSVDPPVAAAAAAGGSSGGRTPWAAWVAPPPTVALSSTRRFNVELGREEKNQMQQQQQQQEDQRHCQDAIISRGVDKRSNGNLASELGTGASGGDGCARGEGGRERPPRGPGELLVLTSACPGWVCYAEKTAPEALPFMSSVKSPQQVMGVLAKRVLPRAWNLPSQLPGGEGDNNTSLSASSASSSSSSAGAKRGVFHVSIAQCYDKKLEASRKDFRHEDLAGDAEVDLVLTTAELLELIEESASTASVTAAANPDVHAAPSTASLGPIVDDTAGDFLRRHVAPGDIREPLATGFPAGQAAASADGLMLFGGVDGEGAAGGNSGGYLEYVFRHAAREIFGVDLAGKPLEYREGRNSDFRETSLEVDGRVVLRFAYAYGFRNIQSILAKARRGKCPYHFVEVMACPSGCINGGGQIKPGQKEKASDTRQRVEEVSKVLREGRLPREPRDNPLVQAVYSALVDGRPGGDKARELLHTSYHHVPKLELSNPHMSPW